MAAGRFLSGCSSEQRAEPESPKDQPRLVLLYAPCSVNKYFLSPYNNSVDNTPHHGRFAEKSAVFSKHETECGQSGPAYASIFSGGQAHHHGIFNHPQRINFCVPLITEAFTNNGYDVYFFEKHYMASALMNYGQGTYPNQIFNRFLTGQDKVFAEILNRLASDKGYRAFILTNFTVTHWPYLHYVNTKYEDHREEAEREAFAAGFELAEFDRYRKLYSENTRRLVFDWHRTIESLPLNTSEVPAFARAIEVLYKVAIGKLDRLFGEVVRQIEKAGLFDESLIVYTADHGEYTYRENAFFNFAHGMQLSHYDISVPLMISGPSLGITPGAREYVTRSIDVFPTIAGLCGLSISEDEKPPGRDLSTSLLGKEKPPELVSFSHTMLRHEGMDYDDTLYGELYPGASPQSMWVSARKDDLMFKIGKLDRDDLKTFKPGVFDLRSDPDENFNLYDRSNSLHRGMMKSLRDYKESLVHAHRLWRANPETGVSREEQEKLLRQIGYL